MGDGIWGLVPGIKSNEKSYLTCNSEKKYIYILFTLALPTQSLNGKGINKAVHERVIN